MVKHLHNTVHPNQMAWCGRQSGSLTEVWNEVTCGNCIRSMRSRNDQFNQQWLDRQEAADTEEPTMAEKVRDTVETIKHLHNVIQNSNKALENSIASSKANNPDWGYQKDATMRWTRRMVKAINILRLEYDLPHFGVSDDDNIVLTADGFRVA